VNEVTLTGRLTPKTQNTSPSYQGHYVRLEFARTLPVGGDDPGTYRSALTAAASASGDYSFVVDKAVPEDATARLEVRSPVGTQLASATLRDTLENGNLKPIEVDPEAPFVIAPHPDPLKGRPQSLTVLVLDREGRYKFANRQVVIVAAATQGAQPRPVFSARTDVKGYASGQYPRGTFAEAWAEVAGVRTPLRLEPDGTFPLRVVFAMSLPAAPPVETAPGDFPPRAPDQEQLLNSPESFSTDLGLGGSPA